MYADEAEVWEVEEIVNSSIYKGIVQYRVRWVGRAEFKDKWETTDHLVNYADKLKEYRQKNHRMPRDEREV